MRSAWKAPYFSASLLSAIKNSQKKPIRTRERASTIIPAFVGSTIEIHRGNSYVPKTILPKHVGMKIGQLVATKKPIRYTKAKN